MYSRICRSGLPHLALNRLVICGLICVPKPRMKRPCEAAAKSQAVCAMIIGLRGKATAIAVPSDMPSVASEA